MASEHQSILQTCDRIVRLKIPNLLRLFLNPFVAQTCVALNEMVHFVWPSTRSLGDYPTFLANSGEEALSGAIKLARYTQNQRCEKQQASVETRTLSSRVFLIDDNNWFENFASASIVQSALTTANVATHIEFIPNVICLTTSDFVNRVASTECCAGTVVLAPNLLLEERNEDGLLPQLRAAIETFQADDATILITVVTTDHLVQRQQSQNSTLHPDIVVFDESWTMKQVPFGAFSARHDLYRQWMTKGMSTFHSTTYQPNTISTLHLLKCLEENLPDFFQQLRPSLKPLLVDLQLLRRVFRNLFNPALARLISIAGFDSEDATASGHYVRVGQKRYFDGVGGVACSLRGHNPATWVSEIESMDSARNVRSEVSRRLYSLTGLQHHVPAVSGGAAVEHALKLGLIAQSPRSCIVALKGGFGGKTLLALSGTSKPSYKKGLDPLYPDVLYIDPFADDAVEQLKRTMQAVPVALVQLELIQGVGGVREIPRTVLDYLVTARQDSGILIFVDEIQTAMFRTGPFVRSRELSIEPDLLTIGKGTSDMIFPFAMTLYSDRVHSLLAARGTTLPSMLHERYGYEIGYRALLNTLQRNDIDDTVANTKTAGRLFQESLEAALAGISIVKQVRCFGLLIGIELQLSGTLMNRIGLNAAQLYLLRMMQHKRFPLLMGFCQYEPNILKFTPPLTTTRDEVERVCRTISDALRTPSFVLLATGFRALLRGRK